MHFDFDTLLDPDYGPGVIISADEAAEEAAWLWLMSTDWVPVPCLFFAMKQVVREQMAGG